MKHLLAALTTALLLTSRLASAQTAADELARLYVGGQLDSVLARGPRELRRGGEQPLVCLWLGRAYADRRQFAAALPYLRRCLAAAESSPEARAWSQAYLGTCYYAQQDYAQARQALEAVAAGGPAPKASAYARKRLGMLRARDEAAGWQLLETAHFRFRFRNPQRIGDVAAYAAAREQAYAASNAFFQARPPGKTDFYVWDDRAAAQQVLQQEPGFTRPELLTIHVLDHQTPGHEIAHLLLAYGLDPRGYNRFLDEGAAVCFDQNGPHLAAARRATGGRVDVWRMWQQPQAYPDEQLYAVGGALLEYLLAHAPAADVKQLLQTQSEEVGRRLFGPQVAAFEQELRR